MTPALLFDAVLFDLDGTLLATDSFWVKAADAGTRRAFSELGIERALPTPSDWLGMVGFPIAPAFDEIFADLDPSQRRLVLERCLEEEKVALERGDAELMPGALSTLEMLRDAGLRLAIASNCEGAYLEAVLPRMGLLERIDEARCLDSPGVETKADMVADLLRTFGTRSAVMVGDRVTDRDAAWANGLPHVHLEHGFAREDEDLRCEAVLKSLGELVPRLRARASWIEGALDGLDLSNARRVGITGRSASGKSLFARDVARLLADRGTKVTLVSLDSLLWQDGLAPEGVDPFADPEVERRVAEVERDLVRERDDLLVLEGRFLEHPRIAKKLDALLRLVVSEGTSSARNRARGIDGDRFVEAEGAAAGIRGPRDLDAENPLGRLPG